MKKLFTLLCACGMLPAPALVVRPDALPSSPWADTEVTTNLTFAGRPSGSSLRDFRIDMSFLATPSNNVQIAFGCDGDANGVLSVAETDFTFGWDCGCWQIDKDVTWAAVTTNAVKELAWTLRMRNGAPLALDVTENGAPLAAMTNAPSLAGFYDPAWDLMRITVRGVDAAAERLVVAARPWGCVLKFR